MIFKNKKQKSFLLDTSISVDVTINLDEVLRIKEISKIKEFLNDDLRRAFIWSYRFTLHHGLFLFSLNYAKIKKQFADSIEKHKFSETENYDFDSIRWLPLVIDEIPYYFYIPIVRDHDLEFILLNRLDNSGNFIVSTSWGAWKHSFYDEKEKREAIAYTRQYSAIILKTNLLNLSVEPHELNNVFIRRVDVSDYSTKLEPYDDDSCVEGFNSMGEKYLGIGVWGNIWSNRFFHIDVMYGVNELR